MIPDIIIQKSFHILMESRRTLKKFNARIFCTFNLLAFRKVKKNFNYWGRGKTYNSQLKVCRKVNLHVTQPEALEINGCNLREYLKYYRGPGFLDNLAPYPPPAPLSRQLFLFLPLPVCRRWCLLTIGKGGGGQIIRRRESPALYNTFNTLWL